MKVAGACISHRVGEPWLVIVPRHVAVETLVDPKEAEQVGWHLVSGGAALPFPKESVEVVRLAQDSALPDIERLAEGLQVNQTSCELQIRVGNVAVRIFCRYKPVNNLAECLVVPILVPVVPNCT